MGGSVPIDENGSPPPKVCKTPDAFNIHRRALKIGSLTYFWTSFRMVPMIFGSDHALRGEGAPKFENENFKSRISRKLFVLARWDLHHHFSLFFCDFLSTTKKKIFFYSKKKKKKLSKYFFFQNGLK